MLSVLATGQFSNPQSVIAFKLAEQWASDVSDDIAQELRRPADLAGEDVSSTIVEFVERHAGWERRLALSKMVPPL